MRISHILLISLCISNILAFDSEQLEVFDVVDEVKENFYDLLNISKVCIIYYSYLCGRLYLTMGI